MKFHSLKIVSTVLENWGYRKEDIEIIAPILSSPLEENEVPMPQRIQVSSSLSSVSIEDLDRTVREHVIPVLESDVSYFTDAKTCSECGAKLGKALGDEVKCLSCGHKNLCESSSSVTEKIPTGSTAFVVGTQARLMDLTAGQQMLKDKLEDEVRGKIAGLNVRSDYDTAVSSLADTLLLRGLSEQDAAAIAISIASDMGFQESVSLSNMVLTERKIENARQNQVIQMAEKDRNFPNELAYPLSYIVVMMGELVRDGMAWQDAFVAACENENYYGMRSDVVEDRRWFADFITRKYGKKTNPIQGF